MIEACLRERKCKGNGTYMEEIVLYYSILFLKKIIDKILFYCGKLQTLHFKKCYGTIICT